MVVHNLEEMDEGSAIPTDPHHTPTIIQPSTQPQKKQKHRNPKRKDTQIPQSSGPTKHVEDEAIYKELDDSLVRAATTASSLEAEQDDGGGPRCQETMGDIIAQTKFENVSKLSNDLLLARGNTLRSGEDTEEVVSLKRRVKKLEQKKRSRTHRLKRLYKVGLRAREESSGGEENLDDADMFDVNTLTGDEVLAKLEVAVKDVNLTVDEVTLAQALAALKSVKPKVKTNVVEEPSVPVSAASTKDSAATTTTTATIPTPRKGIFDEEERLAREKDEANVALTEEWGDIEAKSKEENNLQLKEQKRRGTDHQQELKKEYHVTELVEKSCKKAKTELKENLKKPKAEVMKSSSKRAGEELEQESIKKQKVDEDKETTEL
ncbi:hypothetical protein Tco_0011475 [Tanacetum coccineum]